MTKDGYTPEELGIQPGGKLPAHIHGILFVDGKMVGAVGVFPPGAEENPGQHLVQLCQAMGISSQTNKKVTLVKYNHDKDEFTPFAMLVAAPLH